ncbi:MAG: outer membrane lipoprotein carrier protein LolA [Betaproteobacteria bacterium]|nr:outer membrane lipoprotein carrier protein LolA [Betaproteobacteria bacterium]
MPTLRLRLALLATVVAAAPAAASGWQKYQEFRENYGQGQLLFDQTVRTGAGALHESSGNISYGRGGMFRVEYLDPEPIEIISDSLLVWVYEPSLNQVQISAAGDAFAHSGLVALLAAEDPKQRFAFSDLEVEGSNLDWLLIRPFDSQDAQFEEMRIGFSEPGLPERMVLIDLFDNTIRATFRDLQPAEFAREDFVFNPPAGVDVFRQ